MTISKHIKIISNVRGYDGFFKIDCIKFQHSLFQGGTSPVIYRELFGRGQAVVILLYDLSAQVVVLVEQCRAGALMHALKNANNAWLLEPVAGMIDAGETPYDACVRECQEEAGINLSEFDFIYRFYPSPGGSDEILHLYSAQIDSRLLPDYAGLAGDHEDIRVVKLPFAEAKQRLLAAEFNVASTIIGLQWLFFQKLGSDPI